MKNKQSRIQALIYSIINYLQSSRSGEAEQHGVDLILDKLESMGLANVQIIDTPAQASRHHRILEKAITGITAPELDEIARCLAACAEDLVWREDNSQYYAPSADLGEGYKKCNVHTLLIGSDACGYHHADFSLGIFMLGPRTLYRDHKHDAPELYLNLSEKTGWRFSSGQWQDYPAGSLIWNAAGERHATRVYEQPFISVFAWLENVDSSCHVIPFDDWAEIEQGLAQEQH